MFRYVLALVLAIMVWSLSQPSRASETNITKAGAEILAMKQDELRALLNYFAECANRASGVATVVQACRSALVRYQTEYGGSRAIDSAISDIEQQYAARRAAAAVGESVPSGLAEGDETALKTYIGIALRNLRKDEAR